MNATYILAYHSLLLLLFWCLSLINSIALLLAT